MSAPAIKPSPRTFVAPRASTVVIWCVGMLVALFWIVPIYWMFVTSFKPIGEILGSGYNWLPLHPTLANYSGVLAQPIGKWFVNSVVVAVSSTVLSLLTGALTGYALARLNFPGRNVLFIMVLLALMIYDNAQRRR